MKIIFNKMDFGLFSLLFANKPENKPLVEVKNKPEAEAETENQPEAETEITPEVEVENKPELEAVVEAKTKNKPEVKLSNKKIKLQIIVNKLNEITEFANKYDIKINDASSYFPYVRVMHKEKTIQEKYIYNPSLNIEYRTDNSFCYDILYHESCDYYKTIEIIPKTIIPFHNTDFGTRSKKIEHYNKNVNFEDIDYDDIVKYITTSDLTMWWKSDTTQDYLAPNEWLCSKCNSKCNTKCSS